MSVLQWRCELPVLFLRCGFGGIRFCGAIILLHSWYAQWIGDLYFMSKWFFKYCGFCFLWSAIFACRVSQRLATTTLLFQICFFNLWKQQLSSRFCKIITYTVLIFIMILILLLWFIHQFTFSFEQTLTERGITSTNK